MSFMNHTYGSNQIGKHQLRDDEIIAPGGGGGGGGGHSDTEGGRTFVTYFAE